jgi:hypothetical protein
MNLRSVRPEDVVYCQHRGRWFWGKVEARLHRGLSITPLTRNISYHRVGSRDVAERYAHRPPRAGKVATRSIRSQDLVSYQDDDESVIARVTERTPRGRLRVLPLTTKGAVRELALHDVTAHYARPRARQASQAGEY